MVQKVKDLFGERNIDTIDIILPDKRKLMSATKVLDRLYKKRDLVQIYSAFCKWTEGYAFQMVDEDGLSASQSIVVALSSKKMQNYKDTYLDFLGAIVADERNLKMYFDFMPEKSHELFRKVIYRGCMSIREAKKYGLTRGSGSGYSYWYDSEINNEYAWFTMTNFGGYYYSNLDNNYYVYLESVMCRYFMPVLMPEVYAKVETVQELEGKEWAFTNFERDAFRDIPLIEGMFSQGVIAPGKTKLMMASTEKKVDQLGMADFPTSLSSENLRARMLTAYIAYMQQEGFDDFDVVTFPVQDQAYKVVRNFPVNDSGWFQICTPFITGLRKSVLQESYARDILRYVVSFLFTFAKSGWVPVKALFEHMYSNLLNNGNRTFAFEPNRYNIENLPENSFIDEELKPDKIITGFTQPLIRGFLYLLASWGIIETAENTRVRLESSPFDSLEYVRVTVLGRYALGFDKSYTAPEVEKKIWFELDDERLIFRSLSEDNPYIVILKDVSNSIGGGRYEVTAESFLSHCSTRADVEQKIDIFKQYIGRELPQIWKDFFAEMLRHCQPLEKLPITSYKMYRVSKDNTALQRLLTTDEKLRSLVIRAEGYRILVAKGDMTKFENRLKSFGYLL